MSRKFKRDINNQDKIDRLFARFCIEEDLVSEDDLKKCINLKKRDSHLWGLIGLQDLLIDLGYLSTSQADLLVAKHEHEVLGCVQCNAIFRLKGDAEKKHTCKRCGGELARIFKADPSAAATLHDPRNLQEVVPLQLGPTFGPFCIAQELGEGGMGKVYKARDTRNQKWVALKILHPEGGITWEDIKRFQHEVRSITEIDHPNIVSIHDVGTVDGKHYYSMDYIDGDSLKDVIHEKGTLPLDQALAIAYTLADALDAAHAKGIIHRDIKPDNIICDREGSPHLLDFSIAKIFTEVTQVTKIGTALGTPSYMAPEQAAGHIDQLDHKTDIYSLGVLLYEMVTGMTPFHGKGVIEILDAVENDEPLPPSELNESLPEPIEKIILQSMQKKKDDRYSSIRAMASDIERFRNGEQVEATGKPTKEGSFFSRVFRRFR